MFRLIFGVVDGPLNHGIPPVPSDVVYPRFGHVDGRGRIAVDIEIHVVHPLPFMARARRYFLPQGVQSQAGGQGSRFQGIQLDVNFRLPLNQILQYGQGMKKLIEGTQQ